jgi:hypothetical protein
MMLNFDVSNEKKWTVRGTFFLGKDPRMKELGRLTALV